MDGKHFSAASVAAHCSTNSPGHSFWQPKLKDGTPPNWPHEKESPKKWTDEEREKVLEALGYLPKEMLRDDIHGIYRMEKSLFYPNPASGDRNGDIVIYDTAFANRYSIA